MISSKINIYGVLPTRERCLVRSNNLHEHVDSIVDTRYKTLSSLSYELLDELIKNSASCSLSEHEITFAPPQKPRFSSSALHFNISHSNNAVAAVISDREVGIDIEKVGKLRERILQKCFSVRERELVTSPEAFYRLWTLKEAYLKALGTGIDRRLDTLEFSLSDSIACIDGEALANARFYSGIHDGYAVAICSLGHDTDEPLEPIVACI